MTKKARSLKAFAHYTVNPLEKDQLDRQRTDGRTDGWMDKWTDGWMWIDVSLFHHLHATV